MQFEPIQPPRLLKDYIRCCWQVESLAEHPMPKTFSIIADGCPGLIFHQTQSGRLYQAEKPLPPVLLYGQATRHTQLHLPERYRMMGICFHPNALKSLFGLNAHELTDSCLDVRDLPHYQETDLLERLWRETATPAQQFDVLFAYLSSQLRQNRASDDPLISQALDQIISQRGNVSLKKLQEGLRLSERSLERRFKQNVGVSPKQFTRICRFLSSLNQLKKKNYDKLSDVAFDSGYADQSHFTRTFKEFSGILPEEYHKQANKLTESFPELVA